MIIRWLDILLVKLYMVGSLIWWFNTENSSTAVVDRHSCYAVHVVACMWFRLGSFGVKIVKPIHPPIILDNISPDIPFSAYSGNFYWQLTTAVLPINLQIQLIYPLLLSLNQPWKRWKGQPDVWVLNFNCSQIIRTLLYGSNWNDLLTILQNHSLSW